MSLNLGIVIVFLVFVGCQSGMLRSDRYGVLILGIHNRYKLSGVILASSTNSLRSFDLQKFSLTISHDLSHHQIFNNVIDFIQFGKQIVAHRRQYGHLLIVIVIKNKDEISQFKEMTEDLAMSSLIWMMIFTNIDNDEICKLCHNEGKNLFRLKNDTEIFVTCCSNTKLEEWWSIDDKTIKVLPVGELVDEKLQWAKNEIEFHRRRDNAQLQLRIVTIKNLLFFQINNGKYSGFIGDLITSLQASINFSIAPLIFVKEGGRLNRTESKWSGMMGILQRGEADLTGTFMTMSSERLDIADVTMPVVTFETHLYIKRPKNFGSIHWSAFFQTLEMKLWMAIVVTIILASVLLSFMESYWQPNYFWSTVIKSCQQVIGIFCQQGLAEFPVILSLRIVYYSILLASLIVFAAYSATVTSILSVPSNNLPFNSFEEFSKQREYKLIVIRDTPAYDVFYNSKHPSMEANIFELMRPKDSLPLKVNDAALLICNEKLAFYGSNIHFHLGAELPCEIIQIGMHMIENYALMLPRNSPYTKLINHHIIQLHNNGMLKHLKKKYYSIATTPPQKEELKGVEFPSIAPILAILFGGIVFSIAILFFENQYYIRMTTQQLSYDESFCEDQLEFEESSEVPVVEDSEHEIEACASHQ